MKYLPIIIIFCCLVSVTFAENLLEIAKKEKARREALAKEGKKSRTLTNDDVANLKSTLAIETTSANPELEVDAAVPHSAVKPSKENQKKQQSEEVERYKQEIEKVKKEIGEERAAAGAGGTYHSRNLGSQYRSLRESQTLLKELEEDLAEAQREELEREE